VSSARACDSLFLQVADFGEVVDELVAQSAFLNAEVVQLTVVREERLGFDQRGTDGGILFGGELGGEFYAAEGVDAGFERGDAQQAPFGVGDGLYEGAFVVGGGLVRGDETIHVGLIGGEVIRRQQDGAASETGFEGVQGRIRFAFGRAQACGEFGVGAVCVELSGSGHFLIGFGQDGNTARQAFGVKLLVRKGQIVVNASRAQAGDMLSGAESKPRQVFV